MSFQVWGRLPASMGVWAVEPAPQVSGAGCWFGYLSRKARQPGGILLGETCPPGR